MKKLVTSIVVAMAVCALIALSGCGALGPLKSLDTGVPGHYVFESLNGKTVADFQERYGTDISENYLTFTLDGNGSMTCTTDYYDNNGKHHGSGIGSYELDGSEITLHVDDTEGQFFIDKTIHGSVEAGKLILRDDDSRMVFVKG